MKTGRRRGGKKQDVVFLKLFFFLLIFPVKNKTKHKHVNIHTEQVHQTGSSTAKHNGPHLSNERNAELSHIHASHKQVLSLNLQVSCKSQVTVIKIEQVKSSHCYCSSKSSRVMAKVKQVTRNLYGFILHICRHSKQKRVVSQ